MPEFSAAFIGLLYRRSATEQGGLLDGKDPTAFNTADPLRLWIIQVGVIILMTQFLALGLRKLKQPRVIAEVLGGIILGPTAFGRIPGFTKHVFPDQSRPYLSLVANIGLVLFLFLVGLEIESSVIKRNARLSATVAVAGMVLPFGLGAGMAVPLYHKFIDPSVKFTYFMLFTGVAYSITAFPVLCRILTELQLLDTTVGIVVLSAGVANDIVGWTLLALSVALVNAANGLTALYILLTCVGWALFLLFPGRRALGWLARRTGSVSNGPSMFFMTVVMLSVFASAFFTDVIGVHAIFGAFLMGLIVPREGGLAIALTEKLEDMVSVIFLPLYFTLSGLSTDLGLLDNGITWAFTLGIIGLAYIGKFGGCTIAARYAGFSWREASTIGSLMSCKGLVELIVLNVGLSAGILSQRVFSMFVLEALTLTFATSPAVRYLYPPEKRVRAVASGPNFVVAPGPKDDSESAGSDRKSNLSMEADGWKTRFAVVLDKTEHLPGMMALTQLFLPAPPPAAGGATTSRKRSSAVTVDALRLIELTDYTFSGVMKSSVAESLLHTDSLLNIYRTFGELQDLSVTSSLSVVTYNDLARTVADHARSVDSQLILLPWLPPSLSPSTLDGAPANVAQAPPNNAFEGFLRAAAGTNSENTHLPTAIHSHFVRGVFAQAPCDVALFVDRGQAGGERRTARSSHHLVLPFFGGPDDRFALDLVVQLCGDPKISATVIRVVTTEEAVGDEVAVPGKAHLVDESQGLTIHSTTGFPDTVYGHATTHTRLQSETADSVAWTRYAAPPSSSDEPRSARVTSALTRVTFVEVPSPKPLHAVIARADEQLELVRGGRTRVIVVTGRSRRLAVESHGKELKELIEENGTASLGAEVRKTMGDVATAFVVAGSSAGLLIVQSA